MSRLVLIIDGKDRVSSSLIARLAKGAKKSLIQVKQAIDGNLPIFDLELFDRREPEAAGMMLAILKQLEDEGTQYRAYEVAGSAPYDPGRTYFEVNAMKLSNMIESRGISLEQQRTIGWLEDPED